MTTTTASEAAGTSRRSAPSWVWQAAVFAIVLLIWELGARQSANPTLPTAGESLSALVELLGSLQFWSDLRDTLAGWAIGLALAIVFGISLGLLLGASDFMTSSSRVTLDFLRSVPGPAIVFILLGALREPFRMKIGLVAFGAGWPIVIQSMYGARALSETLSDVAWAYRISPRDRLFKLALPSAMPFIITGIRLAASVALILNVIAEFWGGASGIGRRVVLFRADDLYAEVYALIILAGVLGILLNRLVVWFERWALSWHPSVRGS